LLKLKDYPRQIQVGDSLWSVKFKRDLGQTETRITWGLCCPAEQTIYIRLGQTQKERLKTFLHELLHAIEEEYGFEVPHQLIHRLEDPLARFLMDNYLGSSV
jgi:hypothetical protein